MRQVANTAQPDGATSSICIPRVSAAEIPYNMNAVVAARPTQVNAKSDGML